MTSSRIPVGSSPRAGCTARHSTGSRTGAARAAKVRSAAVKRLPVKYWRPSLRRSSTFRKMPRTRSSERCALSGVILYALPTRNRATDAITGTTLASTGGTPRDHKERSSLECGNNCEYAQRRVCGPSSVSKYSSSASISLRSAVSRGYRRPPPHSASACTRMSVESMKRLPSCTSTGTVPRTVRNAKSRLNNGACGCSRYGKPTRSSAQRAFSQKWLRGMVIRMAGAEGTGNCNGQRAFYGQADTKNWQEGIHAGAEEFSFLGNFTN